MLWTSWGLKWPSGSKEKKAVLCQQCIFNTVCSYFFDWSFPWTNQNPHSHKVALCQCRLKLVQEIFKKWLMYLYHFTITPVSPFGKSEFPLSNVVSCQVWLKLSDSGEAKIVKSLQTHRQTDGGQHAIKKSSFEFLPNVSLNNPCLVCTMY